MVTQFGCTPFKHTGIGSVDDNELVRVHRDPESVFTDERSDPGKGFPEMILPRECTDRVGGKGNYIGGYPEEKETGPYIKPESILKAGKVLFDRGPEPFRRIRGETERAGRGTANRAVDAGVADLHCQYLIGFGDFWSSLPFPGKSGIPVKIQCAGIHTVAFTGRGWAIVEYMAEMGPAPGAQDFGPLHPAKTIRLHPDIVGGDRRRETRPARAGFEFLPGTEKVGPATDAREHTGLFPVMVSPGKGIFGSFLPGNPELFRSKPVLPFLLGQPYGIDLNRSPGPDTVDCNPRDGKLIIRCHGCT
jgi:hypothetical protein